MTETKHKYTPKIVCVDIDGTLIEYEEFKDAKTFAPVLYGAADAMKRFEQEGWYICIYTTRADETYVADFLNKNGIVFHSINGHEHQPDNAKGGKPIADVYIDDRAIQFNGDWNETVERALKFKAWFESNQDSNTTPSDAESLNAQTKHKLLDSDFAQTQYMLRHYDTINWDVVKFAFAQLAIAIGACWHIYNSQNVKPLNEPLAVNGLICTASFLFLLCSIWIIGRNRQYFVKSSRYLNEIRSIVLSTKTLGIYNKSNYYADFTQPKYYDFFSTQLVCLHMFGVMAGIVAGFALYFFLPTICVGWYIVIGIAVTFLIEAATMCLMREKVRRV